MSKKLKTLKFLKFNFYFNLFFLFLLISFFFYFYLVINWRISYKGKITIPKNKTSKQIIKILSKESLVKNQFLIENYIKILGIEHSFKAGIFDLSNFKTTKQLILGLIKSPKQEYIKLTILEGWNLKEIARYLKTNRIIKSEEEFLKYTGFQDKLKPDKSFEEYLYKRFNILKDKPKGSSLEGYLFPDTYFVAKNQDIKHLIIKMIENFSQKMNLYLKDIKAQKKSVYEIITMASIIEEEAKFKKDKYLISDILWRRLDFGILLQVDSTVNYITGEKKRFIDFKEMKIDSLYNTYKYKGLPKGPICNPSLESIKASIFPKKNSYLYFLSDKNGNLYYSKKLEEHNLKKLKLKLNNAF